MGDSARWARGLAERATQALQPGHDLIEGATDGLADRATQALQPGHALIEAATDGVGLERGLIEGAVEGLDGRLPEPPVWWQLPAFQMGLMRGWTDGGLAALKDEITGLADLLSPETWKSLWALATKTLPPLIQDEGLREELGRLLGRAAGERLARSFEAAPYPQGHDIGFAAGYLAVQIALLAVGVGEVAAVIRGSRLPAWMASIVGPLQRRVVRAVRGLPELPGDLDAAIAELAAAGARIDDFSVKTGGVGPRDVVVRYEADADGLVARVQVLVGEQAEAADVAAHADVVTALGRFTGLLGRTRLLLRKLASGGRLPRPGQRGFEARLEVEKLRRLARMRADMLCDSTLDPAERAAIGRDVEHLEGQLRSWETELDARDEGTGDVAVRFADDAADPAQRAEELLDFLQARSRSFRSFFAVVEDRLGVDRKALQRDAVELLDELNRPDPVLLKRALKRRYAPKLAEAIAAKGPPHVSVVVLREVLDGLDNQSKGRITELWYRAAMDQGDVREQVPVLREAAEAQGIDLRRDRRLDHVTPDDGVEVTPDLRERLLADGYDPSVLEGLGDRLRGGVVHEVKSGRRLSKRDLRQLRDLAELVSSAPPYLQEGIVMKELVVTMIRPEMARGAVGELREFLKGYGHRVTIEVFDERGLAQRFGRAGASGDELGRWAGTAS